ncbi:glutaconyl-CoA decarboxylase subunit gamma domain protein [Ostertagia ostertagi]
MQLKSIISSALMAAGNNTAQSRQIQDIAQQLGVINDAQANKTVPMSAISAIMGTGGAQPNMTNAVPAAAPRAMARAAALGPATNTASAGGQASVARSILHFFA